MGFMYSYKRLDNLCKDLNGIGVTGYIESMEQTPKGANRILGWKDDYYKLKHYRYIRNKIAHDNNADEENMCTEEDELWIQNFYQRILTQQDPLSLYHKATHTEPKATINKNPQIYQEQIYSLDNLKKVKEESVNHSAIVLLMIAFVTIIIVVLIFNQLI